MSIVAFILGLALPTTFGTLLLMNLERKQAVFLWWERMVVGCLMGLTLSMLLAFVAHVGLAFVLSFWTFFGSQLLAIAILGTLLWLYPMEQSVVALPVSHRPAKWMLILAAIVAAWTILKLIFVGTTFLMLVPTYFDDTLDNWNLRGKVFYVDKALTLVMPGEDPSVSPLGVSSYPPTVPLVKTWLAMIAGNWSEPLVNSIHIVWYLLAMTLVFIIVRRKAGVWWALLGSYILASLPLYMMHGTNAYADAFVSSHVLFAIGMTYLGLTRDDAPGRNTFLSIGGIAAAMLVLTKNEGVLVYLPPLLLVLVVGLILQWKNRTMNNADILKTLAWYGGGLVLIGFPWLVFKWSNGLTFGNAKPFTTLGIKWQENVLQAVSVNTFMEGNWLLLFPMLFVLIPWKFRSSFGPLAILTVFFLIIYLGQVSLYLFTGLAGEALRQTGYARGLVQLAPTAVVLTTLLLQKAFSRGLHETSV